jgi:Family of unknown function (DUF6492)
MKPPGFALVCKSYVGDIRRLERLLNSIPAYNADNIPVFVIVPAADLVQCRSHIHQAACGSDINYAWITDEEVIAAHPEAIKQNLLGKYRKTLGSISQQIIKSEAWRAIGCEAYLSLDSDSIFLKPFHKSDFINASGAPYTVMHQAKDMYQVAINRGYAVQYEHFALLAQTVQQVFGRQGPIYSFLPQPFLWSSKVWQALDTQWLAPKNQTIWDAIAFCPSEAQWYGEALLHLESIPVSPIEPLFRVYHFDWQYDLYRKWGESTRTLSDQYLGVCLQSNWEVAMDPIGERSFASKIIREIKRWLKLRR